MENNTYGTIFNDVNLMSEEHLQLIIDTLDQNTSKYFLIKGITSAYQRGAFTMGEVEVLSKSIRLISKEPQPSPKQNNE
jgi:hypothetical protein